jgi:photosystem II stability/assembly factor-like uncharacterized protein
VTALTTVFLGTRKGIFALRSTGDRDGWTLDEPSFLGHIAQHVVPDPRTPGLVLAGCSTGHLGPTVFRSFDHGRTWSEASQPPAFRTGEPLARSLAAAFWLSPGTASQPGVWFLGGSPQGLFRSDDDGATWSPVDGWNDHPMWTTWCEWPDQNTPDGSMLHSISVDPRDPLHMYLGLSSGGVFESHDGGGDWHPLNKGLVHPLLEHAELEFGHDPHCVRLHPERPDRLYQQNHCGVYRMDRDSVQPDRWIRIGDNLPKATGDIGFPVELHPRDPNTVWVFPMDGSDVWPRTSPDGKPSVFRTRDGGESWVRLDDGLPERGWFTVKRQAMTTDDFNSVGVYFGTTSGEVWASFNEGDTWSCLAAHLPEIYSVQVTRSNQVANAVSPKGRAQVEAV